MITLLWFSFLKRVFEFDYHISLYKSLVKAKQPKPRICLVKAKQPNPRISKSTKPRIYKLQSLVKCSKERAENCCHPAES